MRINYLQVTKELKIPIYSFGNKQEIFLIAGVHGNEKSGVLVLQTLVQRLKRVKNKPDLAILPIANPEAYKGMSRVNPKDKIDLNRIFPVKKIKGHSYKIAKSLQTFAKKFRIIVDIHAFTKQQTLICGVELRTSAKQTQQRIKKLMIGLNLQAICLIDHQNEPKKDGSLAGYLQGLNKLAFGIELPPREVLKRKQINQFVNNLISFSKNFETFLKKRSDRTLKTYVRQQYFATDTGYFRPLVSPGKKIKRGQTVGQIRLVNSNKIEVKSPFDGVLISISYPRRVKKQEKLFVVGKPVD